MNSRMIGHSNMAYNKRKQLNVGYRKKGRTENKQKSQKEIKKKGQGRTIEGNVRK